MMEKFQQTMLDSYCKSYCDKGRNQHNGDAMSTRF